ncbi:MAG: TonB-dependent receptor plug domain-containing protein [Gemmatimonadota bacterium]
MRTPIHCAGAAVILSIGILGACAPAASRAAGVDRTLITAEDIEKNPNEPIENLIQRKVPGVVVTRAADGSIALQIRGASTINGEITSPLYVVNDLPFDPGPGGALTGINPRNIVSIKVLKGGDALYGVQGANGVIVIKTK